MFEWLSQVWGFDSGNNDSDSNASNNSDDNDSDNNDSDNNDSDNNKEISVSNSFQEIVGNAVDLLRRHSPQDYQALQNYQAKITPANSTAYYYWRNEIGIQDSDLNGDLHYLASLIVHENRHAKWYKETPSGTWQNSQQEELDCIDCQANALQRIGGAWWRINYLRAQDGNHYLKERD